MSSLIWIAVAAHIIVAALVAGAIVAWRAHVADDSNDTERLP